MLIYPVLQGKLFLLAFLCGIVMGALWDLVFVLRVLTGAYPKAARLKALYQRPLPLVGRAVGFSTGSLHRAWQVLSLAFWQLLFPVFGALAVLVLCFGYHNGALRLPVPLLLVLGFFLWRRLFSRRLARAFDLLAFLLAALSLYFRALVWLPIGIFCRFFCRFVWRPIQALAAKWQCKHLSYRSRLLCEAQLAAAEDGSLFVKKSIYKRKRNLKLWQTIKKEGAPPHP
ncbi:MAG: hypothetical protein E7639_02765 [Ruminococcaceae bacterium]|nr:hypothetical protein [Oscillospiraceae bacterium]